MEFRVLGTHHHLKICRIIVADVAIPMMHDLSGYQWSPDHPFGHQAVFEFVGIRPDEDADITIRILGLACLEKRIFRFGAVAGVTRARTKPTIPTLDARRSSFKRLAAVFAITDKVLRIRNALTTIVRTDARAVFAASAFQG
jgi:hypothetical protein